MVADRKISGQIVEDISICRAKRLHDLPSTGPAGIRCRIIQQETAHVRRGTSRRCGRTKQLHGDILEFFVWIGCGHPVAIVGWRPSRGRMTGKNLISIQNIKIGIGL